MAKYIVVESRTRFEASKPVVADVLNVLYPLPSFYSPIAYRRYYFLQLYFDFFNVFLALRVVYIYSHSYLLGCVVVCSVH
jgi:hypothetical protein